jgi:hypothetical protein
MLQASWWFQVTKQGALRTVRPLVGTWNIQATARTCMNIILLVLLHAWLKIRVSLAVLPSSAKKPWWPLHLQLYVHLQGYEIGNILVAVTTLTRYNSWVCMRLWFKLQLVSTGVLLYLDAWMIPLCYFTQISRCIDDSPLLWKPLISRTRLALLRIWPSQE